MTQHTRPSFDSGPLSWVMGEVREALGRSRAALLEATPDALATPIQHAKSHLHQAHGALQMVDVEGVGQLLEAAEQLLDRVKAGALALDAAPLNAIGSTYEAVLEYLDELLAGATPQPVRLFPWYRSLRELLGAERVHPADLLALDSGTFTLAPGAAADVDVAACRARFEKGLLLFLKGADDAARQGAARVLAEALAPLAEAQAEPEARTLWSALHAVAALLADGLLTPDLYLKQLLGMINLQIRRLSQGQAGAPETLLRDALFFIAAAAQSNAAAGPLRDGFGLDGLVPADYAQRRYGTVDAGALAAARSALQQAKQGAETADPAVLQGGLDGLAAACSGLHPGLAALTAALAASQHTAARGAANAGFGLEQATALLLCEHGLDQIRRLPAEFVQHAEALAERLHALAAGQAAPEAPPWQDELLRQIQQSQTVSALGGELKSALRQIEKTLEDFSEDGSRLATLEGLAPTLNQLRGAYAILDLDHAVRAVEHVQQGVRALLDQGGAADRSVLDHVAQNVGALGFFTDQLSRQFDTARQGFVFDADAGLFREGQVAEVAPIADAAPPEMVQVPAVPVPSDGAAIDAELLEIFIGEAQEVLAAIMDTLPAAQANPSDQEALTRLRRSFHTLKGSGRMVALDEFADAAAAIEKTMNAWLAEARPATPGLLALIERAGEEFSAWVDELVSAGQSPRQGQALVDAAMRVLHGEPEPEPALDLDVAAFEPPAALPAEQMATPAAPDLIDLDFAPVAEEPNLELSGLDSAGGAPVTDDAASLDLSDFEPAATPEFGEDLDFAATPQPMPEPELEELTALPAIDSEPAQADAHPEASELPPELDTPASAQVIDFPSIVPAAPADDNTKHIGAIAIPLPLFNIYLAETDELVRVLTRDFGEWRLEGPRPASKEALKAIHTLAGTSATVGFKALRELAYAMEMALQEARAPGQVTNADLDLFDEGLERARQMLAAFGHGDLAGHEPGLVARFESLRDALKARPASAETDLGARLDALFAAAYEAIIADPPVTEPVSMKTFESKPSAKVVDEIDDLFASAFDALEEAPGVPPAPQPIPASPEPEVEAPLLVPPGAADVVPVVASLPADELDPDLLPVFLEEGADLFPEIGRVLRQWQENPADTASANLLLRTLHTVKGSARMAGAMRLGQHTHDIETQVENMLHAETSRPEAFDDLLANFDQAQFMFEQLQQPEAPEAAEAAVPKADTAPEEEAIARVPLVRVRADILDRLVNQAGEVSIARSKLENQIGAMKGALADFGDDLARLRRHLREVELQAESQIASRMSIAGERDFDPLEFDRFTRLQELTRMMAESVSDVDSLYDSLTRNVERANEDLLQQARMTRDLQHDLMRVRMVPFASISERLFRVARQAAKELDKRVNLDIRGGNVEMDRSVLEQMAGPFEHLLRNAIVHGIESRIDRAAAGKPETGELLIQVSQQGNEVHLQFSDDGAGLNLQRIRAKAVSQGLLADADEVSDAEAADLIFEPGFSTADTLTELAGRGVGMDVVRSEAQALGGQVGIHSEAGKGTRFTIRLPLTLAVTQVVLVQSGERTYALPSILVEQLMQMKEASAAEARAAGSFDYRGRRIAMHYLSHLLGDMGAEPVAQRSAPVLILQHGDDKLALQVDDVVGNREVVVKNIGPQLSRMVGIAGATVLGSGDIVLILNPVALAHHLAHHPELKSHFTAAPAQTVNAAKSYTIMVVDDSVTVRKVTQRLLEREGYHVLLAKDGVDALEQLQQHRPHLMLVDIEMPRMDGFDLTRNIRGGESTQAIPIIMITSRAGDKHRNLALELGVNAYFGKPYQDAILLAAISGLLEPAA